MTGGGSVSKARREAGSVDEEHVGIYSQMRLWHSLSLLTSDKTLYMKVVICLTSARLAPFLADS